MLRIGCPSLAVAVRPGGSRPADLSALARKFGDVFGRRTPPRFAASRRPSGAETEGCLSSQASVSYQSDHMPAFGDKQVPRVVPSQLSRSRGHGRRDSAGVRDDPSACGLQRPAPDRQTPLRPRFCMIKHVSARRRRARALHQHRWGPVRDGHRRPPASTVAARPANTSSGGRRDHCQTGRGLSWISAASRSLAPSASITGRAGGGCDSSHASTRPISSFARCLTRPTARRGPRTRVSASQPRRTPRSARAHGRAPESGPRPHRYLLSNRSSRSQPRAHNRRRRASSI